MRQTHRQGAVGLTPSDLTLCQQFDSTAQGNAQKAFRVTWERVVETRPQPAGQGMPPLLLQKGMSTAWSLALRDCSVPFTLSPPPTYVRVRVHRAIH